MAQDTSVQITNPAGQVAPSWTVPPYCHDVVGQGTPPPGGTVVNRSFTDQSFALTQGIVYEINVDHKVMMQNVSENEDDYIEFSKHGDPCGIWSKVDVGNFLEVSAPIFLYNRTHKQNAVMAVISE